MRKGFIALLGAATMFSGSATAQNCTVPPTCENLGYVKTAADCDGLDTLKCPFDQSKLYCPQGGGNMSAAAPGAILYSDGTISDSVIASKTPVGIVAYVNGSNGFAVALTESNQTWGGYGYNVSCLGDMDSGAASADMNGRVNTQCLVSDSQTHPAANYCNTFSAVSSGKGSSGWYLPAAGELKAMSYSYGAINLGLQKLSKTQISSNYYWSSSEYTGYYGNGAWVVRPSDGSMNGYYKNNSNRVRCALAF